MNNDLKKFIKKSKLSAKQTRDAARAAGFKFRNQNFYNAFNELKEINRRPEWERKIYTPVKYIIDPSFRVKVKKNKDIPLNYAFYGMAHLKHLKYNARKVIGPDQLIADYKELPKKQDVINGWEYAIRMDHDASEWDIINIYIVSIERKHDESW